MKIRFTSDKGKIQAILSDKSDWNLFNRIAELIAKEFNGHWIVKADGIDQRYWDIEIENVVLTLHSEHYLGISLFPTQQNNNVANNLVRKIGNWIERNI